MKITSPLLVAFLTIVCNSCYFIHHNKSDDDLDPAGEARTMNAVSDAQLSKLPKTISVDELKALWGPSEGQPGPRITYRSADHDDQFFWVYYKREDEKAVDSRTIVERIVRADRIEEGGSTVWPKGYITPSESEAMTRISESSVQSMKMTDLLLKLPSKFWESKPTRTGLAKMFPDGVPEEFVSISTGGAQNDLDVLRLDGSSIAITAGYGENPDHATSINKSGRNLEVLRRTAKGWEDITDKVLRDPIGSNQVAKLYSHGRLVVSDTSRNTQATFRYNGTAFMPEDK